MRRLFLILTLVLSAFHFASAQTPSGTLFTSLGNNESQGLPENTVGYLDFPGGTYQPMYTGFPSDLALGGDSLYVADFWGKVFVFNTQTKLPVDSLSPLNANRVGTTEDLLLVGSTAQPHLRVFDRHTMQYQYGLDTSDLPTQVNDITVVDDVAYLLLSNEIRRLDLSTQTMLPTVNLYPYQFGRDASELKLQGDQLYALVYYSTAVPRMDLFRYDLVTQQVDSLAHLITGLVPFNLVCNTEGAYFANYPTRYDFPGDSLSVTPGDTLLPIAIDPVTDLIFAYLKPTGDTTALYFAQGNALLPNPTILPSWPQAAVFQPTTIPNSIPETSPLESTIELFPNPTSNEVNLRFDQAVKQATVQVLDLSGKLILEQRFSAIAAGKQVSINLSDLAAGSYLVHTIVGSESTTQSLQVVP